MHPEPKQALCDGDQALIDADLQELASVLTDFPPLLGRTVTRPPDRVHGVPEPTLIS
jgi:3-deoxy-7-phosphoheptulonate synthase